MNKEKVDHLIYLDPAIGISKFYSTTTHSIGIKYTRELQGRIHNRLEPSMNEIFNTIYHYFQSLEQD